MIDWPITAFELAMLASAALAGGFIRGFVGFGGALVIIMVGSAALGAQTAVPVAALSGLPATLQLLPGAVRDSDRRFVVPFGIACFAAAPAGTWVLVSVPPALMAIAISTFVLGMVVLLHRGWRPARPLGPLHLAMAGAGAGLVQGSAGVGGPPAVAIALSRAGTHAQQRANVIGAVTALALCALLPMAWHGLFDTRVLILSALVVPVYSGATWLGARAFARGGQPYFRTAALLLLAATGVITFAIAVRGYLYPGS